MHHVFKGTVPSLTCPVLTPKARFSESRNLRAVIEGMSLCLGANIHAYYRLYVSHCGCYGYKSPTLGQTCAATQRELHPDYQHEPLNVGPSTPPDPTHPYGEEALSIHTIMQLNLQTLTFSDPAANKCSWVLN